MKIAQFIKDIFAPEFSSKGEESFCGAWLDSYERRNVHLFLVITLSFHLFLIFAYPLLGQYKGHFYIWQTLNIATCLLCLPGFSFNNVEVKKGFASAAYLVECCGFYYILSVAIKSNPNLGEVVNIAMIVFAAMLMGTMYVVSKPIVHLVLATMINISGMLAVASAGFHRGIEISSWIIIVSCNYLVLLRNYEFRVMQISVARREFNARKDIIPTHIIRNSVKNIDSMETIFKPEEQNCVYIASDWRGYQKLSKNVTAKNLSHALNSYYELCETLLQRHFPEGNYYSDWIADELFVVILPLPENPEFNLCESAVNFSVELIQNRVEFEKKFDFPKAIDIGLSFGPSIVGLMGPKSHKKATALGELPGQARRYQEVGKYLRKHYSESDRVVFGNSILMNLRTCAHQIEKSLPDEEMRFRDLDDSHVYFVTENSEKNSEQSDDKIDTRFVS